MINSIYPPDHLLRKWEELIIDQEQNVDVVLYEAFQAGADQELEACCEWLTTTAMTKPWDTVAQLALELRDARRPKPPSLKEQALALLDDASDRLDAAHENTIRRALESLPD